MYSHHSSKGTNTADRVYKFKLNDVLVEVDGWRLVRPLFPTMIGVKSYIVHMDCKQVGKEKIRTSQMAGVDMGTGVSGVCTWCGKTPPDEIVGLEILHNGKI